jgi:hypothetical protein
MTIKSPLITLKQLNRAIYDAQNDLYRLGLWYEGSQLTEVEIYLCPLPRLEVRGLFYHGENAWSKLAGYYEGKMYIPRMSFAHLANTQYDSLRDVIRHEYAHAFAHHYPELIFKTEFSKVFGGSYGYDKPSKMHSDAYASEYAKTIPMEDFAETFMIYLKRNGKMPRSFTHKKLIAKWKFVEKVIKKASQY